MSKVNNIDRAIIYEMLKEYKDKFNDNQLQIFDIVKTENKDYWAQFLSEDLYNKKYILYINNELTRKSKKFVKRILFHEFTHLSDAMLFQNYSKDFFKHIMKTYSEFHASEIEMSVILQNIDKQVTLQSKIINDFTIEDKMKDTFNNILNDFNDTIRKNIHIKTNNLYYFCGYIKALKNYGINYEYDKWAFHKNLILPCNEIITYLVCYDDLDFSKIIDDYIKLKCIIVEINQKYKQPINNKSKFKLFDFIKNIKSLWKL